MKCKQITFTKPNTAELTEIEYGAPGENEVLVKTMVSSLSAGTERANISGDKNVSPDGDSGEPPFPKVLGYSSSGIIVQKGADVTGFEVGDRVAMIWSQHKEYNILPVKNIVKIPDEMSFAEAALCHISIFPMAAVRKTRLELGESMLIMGLGILGLFGVQMAKIAGAVPVIAADPNSARREKALAMGADYALDPMEEGFADKVKELTDGGANTAIEVTGIGAGLNETLDCMAMFGRVALLGCTRDKNFTVDYYRKVHGPGITLVGAHTQARPEVESRPGFFTSHDDMVAAVKLCTGKRLDLKSIVDETHSPAECTEVYSRLVSDKNFPPIVQFDWEKIR